MLEPEQRRSHPIIGRDGKVVSTHTGMVDRDACEGEIRELLKTRAR